MLPFWTHGKFMVIMATKSAFFHFDCVLKKTFSRQSYECRDGNEMSKVALFVAFPISLQLMHGYASIFFCNFMLPKVSGYKCARLDSPSRTKEPSIYDPRTNKIFTLYRLPLHYADLARFYLLLPRQRQTEVGRDRAFSQVYF